MMKVDIEKLIYGHDSTQGIISVKADYNGHVTLWRRVDGKVIVEQEGYDCWFILRDRSLLDNAPAHEVTEMKCRYPLRWLVKTQNYWNVVNAVVQNFNRKHHTKVDGLYGINRHKSGEVFFYGSPDQQYLTMSGRTYFKGLQWNDLHRLQFDLETTGLDPEHSEIFLIAIRDTHGYERIISNHEMSEAQMIQELVTIIQARDPDIIENHNIFRFDLHFLEYRANKHRIPLRLGRDESILYHSKYDSKVKVGAITEEYPRFSISGREIIDTYHAVKRWNAITRELKGYGLKDAARHFGLADETREYIDGADVPNVWKTDPDRVRRYALDDVREVAGLSDLLMGTSFALSQMLPMQFQRIATAGTASAIDALMIRGYIHANHSLPQPMKKQGKLKGGMTKQILEGVIENVVKADAESLYPSIMLTYDVKPESDLLGIFLPILEHLTTERLTAKAKLNTLEKGSQEYAFTDAFQGAMKILINSAFGYLGSDEFVQFNDPQAASEVTRYGREILTDMKEIIDELGGALIELDTDGAYFGLPDGVDPESFVESINQKLNRPGINIGFDGHWQAMFSAKMKNYALLSHDGKLTIKGVSFKGSNIEPFLETFTQDTLADLLTGNVDALRKRFRSIVSALQTHKLTAIDVQKTTQLSKSVAAYLKERKTKLPHYEAAISAGLTDLSAGESIAYYKSQAGDWKIAVESATDYDVNHYLKRLQDTAKKFRCAFYRTDFEELFRLDDDLFSRIHRTIKPIQRIVSHEDVQWIELVHGIKLPKYPVIREIVQADDTDAIEAFIDRFNAVDIYRTQLAIHSPFAPDKNFGEHKRNGDFWLELEGSHDDILRMRDAVGCASHVIAIIRKRLGNDAQITARYNGGKSIYLYVSGLESVPVYPLTEKYKQFAEAIVAELPDDMKHIPDITLYTDDRVLRMANTQYPNGGYDVNVPLSLIESEDWTAIKSLSESPEAEDAEPEASPDTQTHFDYYDEVTQTIPDAPMKPKSTARRKGQAIRQAKKVFEALDLHDDDFPIPCVNVLGELITNKGSIGFHGRNKIISELIIRGEAQGKDDREIENQICELFLSGGDPSRYDTIEIEDRDEPNPCGYKLTKKFSLERMRGFEASCSKCAEWCDVDSCYRGAELLPTIERMTYAEFHEAAQAGLVDIIDDESLYEDLGITAIDASLGSGKSYQAMRKSLELARDSNVAIFTNTHAAGTDIINQIPKTGVNIDPNMVVTHIHGKRFDTCQPDKWERGVTCTQCPVFKNFYPPPPKSDDDEKGVARLRKAKQQRIQIIMECKGGAMDLDDLQRVAEKHSACASVVSKILAHSESLKDEISHNVLAVLPHAYLINSQYQGIIHKINPITVFIDEGDMIPEMLLTTHQATLTVAETRARLDSPYTKSCNMQCDKCHVHFADSIGNKIEVRRKLSNVKQYDEVSQPQHFTGFLREAIAEVLRIVDKGEIEDYIFAFDAIEQNIARIESALMIVPPAEMTPIHYFDAIQRTLELNPIDGVSVEKLSQGMSITETNEWGDAIEREIRPPTYVVNIDVSPCITLEGRMLFETTKDDGIVDDDPVNQPLRFSHLLTQRSDRAAIKDTDAEIAVKTLLEFANFCDGSGGKVGLYAELRSVPSDSPNDEVEDDEPHEIREREPAYKRGGVKSCALKLRYLDIAKYKQVVNFMQSRNTIMLSGTFLEHEKLAESLLIRPDEIDYRDARVSLHKNALIIHHNPQFGKLTPDDISLAAFGNKHLAQLARRTMELRQGTKILAFEVNSRQGNVLYSGMSNDQQNAVMWLQNECRPDLSIPDWCSPEHANPENFDNWLFIDKLRSSTARAVNRGEFNLSIVHGNGYFDWYDYLPFVQAIRMTVNPNADLDAHIEYNRQRAVLQALLRTPRDERLTVCLYLSGDMSHFDYPDDLKGRVVTTNRLLKALKEQSPEQFASNRENQIELLARVITGFLEGTVTRENLSVATIDFDFKGTYRGGVHDSRKVEVDFKELPAEHRYIVELWLETEKGDSDDSKTVQATIDRLNHVDKCIQDKGYIDVVKDKKGKRQDWKKWIEFLTEAGYLISDELKVTGKKSKIVYRKRANPDDD